MMRPLMRALAPLAMLVLALSGCGAAKTVHARGDTVRLRLEEYRMVPQQIRVDGPRVRIVATDAGILTHNVKLFSTTKTDSEGKPIQIGKGTATAHPGETVVTPVMTLPPGRYRLACSIANHDDLGLHGILIVSGRS
jgi:FtsP/CotA-like multicopper oxidase with cupredoxin domain